MNIYKCSKSANRALVDGQSVKTANSHPGSYLCFDAGEDARYPAVIYAMMQERMHRTIHDNACFESGRIPPRACGSSSAACMAVVLY